MRRRGLALLLSFLAVSAAYTQTTEKYWGFDFGVGAAATLNGETREILPFGWTFSLGADIPLLQFDKLKLRPAGGLKWYSKEVAEESSVNENFRTIKAGLQAEYLAFSARKISLSPILRADYNWSRNYFSKTSYNPWSDFATVSNSDYFLKGTGISADLGLKMNIDNYYIQLHYEYYKPELDVNPAIVETAKEQGVLLPSTHTYQFSSLNLLVGMNINWKL